MAGPLLAPLIPLTAGAVGRGLVRLSQGGLRRPSFGNPRPGGFSQARLQKGTPPKLSDSQRAMVQLIDREVKINAVGGLNRRALAIAAVVNAWAESRLNPQALNASSIEESVGLFQVNRRGALGRPWTRAELADPTNNTRIILSEVRRRSGTLRQARTVGELVSLFTSEVERPADRFRRGRERAQLARTWFGPGVVDARI